MTTTILPLYQPRPEAEVIVLGSTHGPLRPLLHRVPRARLVEEMERVIRERTEA